MAELIFIPALGMGHIPSSVQLAKLILDRHPLVTISVHIVHYSNHANKVADYVDSQARVNQYPTRLFFLTFPPPVSNDPDSLPRESFLAALELHKRFLKETIMGRVRQGMPKPVAFILNMFSTRIMDVGDELGIPSYIFHTSGANHLNLIFYAQSLADNHGIDIVAKFNEPGFSSLVPGFKNPVMSDYIPRYFQQKETVYETLLYSARMFRKAKGILVNTYAELESLGVQALVDGVDENIPRVYPVGPILNLDNTRRSGGSEASEEETKKLIQWLDGQPKSSVVFLCFGSMGGFDEEQVKEIANGLERSGYRFLWALRKPPPPEVKIRIPRSDEVFLDALPEGFIDRTSGQGKCIGWAPQVEVLAHLAIGGFVSHCGWNSTLESLWFGVPVATWPMYAEQHLNTFELVKELELAVEIIMDYKLYETRTVGKPKFLVTAEEVEKAIKNLMNMDDKMKGRIKKVSYEGKKALDVGGSSYNYLGRFIEDALSNA